MERYSHYDMVGKVQSLKANLDERYKEFFCVVQELLQNADDAKATDVVIGQCDCISQTHPLCNIPGIFILNNGPVTDNDLDHIFSIAESNKGSDADKIGKFGLGMKSVFHLCEVFFIFGHQTSSSVKEKDFLEFFDPWDNRENLDAMPDPHPSWRRTLQEKRDLILAEITASLNKFRTWNGNWFGLWLPLRQRDQCIDGSGYLLDYFPLESSAKNWFTPDDLRKTALMMPFFKNLRRISFAEGWLKDFGK